MNECDWPEVIVKSEGGICLDWYPTVSNFLNGHSYQSEDILRTELKLLLKHKGIIK